MTLHFVVLAPLTIAGAIVSLVLMRAYGRRARLAFIGCLLLLGGLLTWLIHLEVFLPQYEFPYTSADTTRIVVAAAIRTLFDIAGVGLLMLAALWPGVRPTQPRPGQTGPVMAGTGHRPRTEGGGMP